MADELDLNTPQAEAPESVDIATKATSDLARGRILLEAQINKLMASLDKRKNQAFDPVWLRAAQGFLAPTKTGRFGESLGNVAGGVAEEQAKQQAQDEQVGKMQLELGQKMYDLKRQSAAQDMLSGALGPKPTMAQANAPVTDTAPMAGATPSIGGGALPSAPQPNAVPPSQTGTQQAVNAIAKNPSIMDEITMTPQLVAAVSALDPALGKIAESVLNSQLKKAELMQKRYSINAQGDQFDTFTGEMIKKGPRTIEVASPFDPDRTMKMPADLVDEYNKLDFNNPNTVNTFLRSHGLNAYAIGKEGPSENVNGSGIPTGGTKLERETQSKISEKREGAKIDEDVKQKTALQDKADASIEVKNSARTIYNYASNPKTANTFGIFAKPGIGPAILKTIENGITVGNYSVGITALPDIIRTAGGTQAEIDAALAVAPKLAQLELGYRTMFLKGQGAVSDMEGKVVQKLGPSLADSPKIVMLKSEMITTRATFDNENSNRYQAWVEKHPNGYIEQYKHSPSYLELKEHYNNKMKQLDEKYL